MSAKCQKRTLVEWSNSRPMCLYSGALIAQEDREKNAWPDRRGQGSNLMKEDNILPYEGEAVLLDDSNSDFDWPAVTRALIETMPWQVETSRMFGREMPVPRMTAWFGDAPYAYSGVYHLCWCHGPCRTASRHSSIDQCWGINNISVTK